MKAIHAVIAFLILTGSALTGNGEQMHEQLEKAKFTKHYDESIFKITEKEIFSIEMIIKGKELKTGVNMLNLIVHDRYDRDVIGLDVVVIPWMPEMGHGVSEKPIVTEKGGGLYSVENIILIKGGHWELRVKVKKNGVEDTAVFDFPDVKDGHTHKMHAPSPSDIDISRTRLSHKKIFYVSYESQLDPILVNKIHTVKVKIETADGHPVKNAEITLDGDMPQHGHGLPTEPEVTQELGDGYYIVEGMKFSMPGWWIINFHIKTQDDEDSVTFNLYLK